MWDDWGLTPKNLRRPDRVSRQAVFYLLLDTAADPGMAAYAGFLAPRWLGAPRRKAGSIYRAWPKWPMKQGAADLPKL